MLILNSVTQPHGRSNLDVLAETIQNAEYDQIDVAAAYVTTGGARDILDMLRNSLGLRWTTTQKRWVVSLDYCRTEPLAIEMLSLAPNSSIRIHDGERVLAQGCTPRTPFHPKAFLFRGNGGHAVFAGSGNLSRSGLNTGNEVGLLMGYRPPGAHAAVAAEVNAIQQWYERIWANADPLSPALITDYGQIYDSVQNRKAPVPTEDDIIEQRRNSSLSPKQLLQLRVCTQLWIQAGNVTRNLGRNVPGNQLMMKRFSRVFFGVPAADVPQNSPLTLIAITHQGATKLDCSLTFSDNGMDKLTLPIPGAGGPAAYDGNTLLFTRQAAGRYRLELGSTIHRRDWLRQSKSIDASWVMQGGRRWGVF